MIETGYIVKYNNQEPWLSGVPYVSVDVEEIWVAGRIGTIRTVTLNGTFPWTGLSGHVQVTGLQAVFADNFKVFEAPNIYMPCAMVQEVNFDSQNYIGVVTYSIVLKDFSGFLFDVNEPVDETSLNWERDGSVTITHKVGAVGVHTGANASIAFDNARNFVLGRTGVGNIGLIGTANIPVGNSGNIFVLSQQESINRVLGQYSIEEVFKYDPLNNTSNGTFKRFSVEMSSGITDDYVTVAVNGTYNVGKNVWDTGLFGRVAANELSSIAFSVLGTLNPLPLSFSVDASSITQVAGGTTGTRTLTARAVYDNSPTVSYLDLDVEGSRDLRNGITQITIKGSIIGSGRHTRRRYDSALSFYNTGIGGWNGLPTYMYNLAKSGATDFNYTSFSYNPSPKNLSVVFNSGLGVITVSASFDDAPFVSGYNEFTWQASADCGLNIFKPQASANVNGVYVVQDLNIINRTNVTLNGNFGYPLTGNFVPTAADAILTNLKNLEGTQNAFLESESYNKSSGDMLRTGFNYSYSKDGRSLSILPVNGKIYAGINV